MKRIAAWLFALFCVCSPAYGQVLPNNVVVSGPLLGNNASLSVTTSSASVALPGPASNLAILLINDGTNELFFNLGTSSGVTATASNYPLPAGNSICITPNYGLTPPAVYSYAAAITSSSTTTLRIIQASACPAGGTGGGGGSGGGGETNYALETGGNLATIATNTAAAVPAGTNLIGKVGIDQTTPGTTNGVQVNAAIPAGTNVIGFTSNDPCQVQAHVFKPLAIATATTTNIITGTSAKKIYICQIILATGIANNATVIEGTTGATCGSGTAGIFGGTTTGTGFVFAANGGVSIGNGGYAIGQTATNANDICIITSAAGPLAGGITYVVQ